jgi:hypothetical protein
MAKTSLALWKTKAVIPRPRKNDKGKNGRGGKTLADSRWNPGAGRGQEESMGRREGERNSQKIKGSGPRDPPLPVSIAFGPP